MLRKTKKLIREESCDIFFKMQSAINVQCEIRYIGTDLHDEMILGLLITGFREGDKGKFYKNFEFIYKHCHSNDSLRASTTVSMTLFNRLR